MRYLSFSALFLFIAQFGIDCLEVSNEAAFTSIYTTAGWGKDEKGEGTSGSGSTPENAKPYMRFLQDFLKSHNIKSVVDVGCGDWQFSRLINWEGIKYTGYDVVDLVIQKNQQQFGKENISFVKMDSAQGELHGADLLICKDVLQHLPHQDIFAVIKQFSKFKYCIITNDVDETSLSSQNIDIPRSHYRTLDLTKAPFKLKGVKVLCYRSGVEIKQVLLIENH